MDGERNDALTDVVNLIAAPLAGGIRAVEQMRRGVDELLRTIENLNRTLENVNEVAERANRLLGDLEEPVRAWIPQMTRTVRAAEEITKRLEGPISSTGPDIERAIRALASPGFAQLPQQLGDFVGLMGEMSKRLGPLTQFAESAGGLFGGFRFPGMPGGKPPADPAPAEEPSSPTSRRPATRTSSAPAPAKRSSASRSTTTSTRKSTPTSTRKSTTKSTTASSTSEKRTTTRRPAS